MLKPFHVITLVAGEVLGSMRLWVIACAMLWALAAPFASAAEVWVEAWRHETSRPLTGIAAGDLTGDGVAEIVALIDGSVTAYALAPEGPRFLAAVEGIPERPTAVAVHPLEAGGPAAVWIGTQSPGIVYVYRYEPEERSFRRLERIRFAWADVTRVIPLDLDGTGYIDVAVVTEHAELVLFRWTPAGYERVPLGELERAVRFVQARDVAGDSRDELIVARDANHLVVAGWKVWSSEPGHGSQEPAEQEPAATLDTEQTGGQPGPQVPSEEGVSPGEVITLWENYVWGTHLALLVDVFRRDRPPEIVSVTSQKVAHHFAPDDDGFVPVRLPVDWPSVAGGLIGTEDVDGDGVAEIVEASPTGLVLWSIGSQMNREGSIELSQPAVFAFHYEPRTGRLIVAGRWGFSFLRKEDANFVNVISRGAPKSLRHPPRFVDGTAYLSAADWEDLLGMRLRFEVESGRISGLRGFHVVIGRVGENQWIYDGRPKVTQSRPFLQGDVLYLGADFASVAGVEVIWEPYTRTLVVDP